MTRVVTTIRKNAREHLRLAWDSYEGHAYLDLRVFYEDGEELKPTKRGITVAPQRLAEFLSALQSATAVGRELRLLPEAEA